LKIKNNMVAIMFVPSRKKVGLNYCVEPLFDLCPTSMIRGRTTLLWLCSFLLVWSGSRGNCWHNNLRDSSQDCRIMETLVKDTLGVQWRKRHEVGDIPDGIHGVGIGNHLGHRKWNILIIRKLVMPRSCPYESLQTT